MSQPAKGPKPKQAQPEAEVSTAQPGDTLDLDFKEVQAAYEEQIGGLTGQLIIKNLLINKLQASLAEALGAKEIPEAIS